MLKDVSWPDSVMEWMNEGAGGGDVLGFCCLCRLSEFWLRKQVILRISFKSSGGVAQVRGMYCTGLNRYLVTKHFNLSFSLRLNCKIFCLFYAQSLMLCNTWLQQSKAILSPAPTGSCWVVLYSRVSPSLFSETSDLWLAES
jgi:hypothetical protein